MRIYSSFVLALAISLSCIAITTPSFAKTFSCEMFSCSVTAYNYPCSVIETNSYLSTWQTKRTPKEWFEINPQFFKAVPGRKSAKAKFTEDGVVKTVTLLPNKVLTMVYNLGQPEADLFARYRCDAGPAEVLAAQTSPSTPSTAVRGCFDGSLEVCEDDLICQKATSARTGSREWETTRTWEPYVKEANRRGLSCGVSEASSQSTTSSSTSSTTSSPSKADKSKAFCTDIGFTAGTEKFGECVLKMMDK